MNLVNDVLSRHPLYDPRTQLVSRPWLAFFASLVDRVGGSGTHMTLTETIAMITDMTEEAVEALPQPLPLPASAHDALFPLPLRATVDLPLVPDVAIPRMLPTDILEDIGGLLAHNHALQAQCAMILREFDPPAPMLSPLQGSSRVTIGAPPTVATVAAGAGANATATLTGTDEVGVITLVCSVLDTPTANSDVLTVTFAAPWATAPVVVFEPANDTAANLAYGIIRLRQGDTTTALWKLRSGGVPLPALTAGTYLYAYHVRG